MQGLQRSFYSILSGGKIYSHRYVLAWIRYTISILLANICDDFSTTDKK